ncbi:MAG: hypothetical protein II961_00590 [Candidatus Riflebacteria bacterium]|nr:hypothetical protein [Candidatus Riflebacteria bacterium]
MLHNNSLSQILSINLFFLLLSIPAESQTINRYIFPYPNRKNDSQIRNSPYTSGYYNYKPIEFSYEPVPTESMKEKANRVIDFPKLQKTEDEEEDIEKILGGMDFDSFSFGEESTIIKELEEEANIAISKQQEEAEKALLAKRKSNVASYAASVEAKKQRDKEAELAALNPPQPTNPEYNPWGDWSEYDENEENGSDTVEITSDKDGKIKIKAPSNNNNTSEQKQSPASSTGSISSATIKP